MTGNLRLLILAAAPLLTAALWMDDQPSFRPYRAPTVLTPAGSVPISDREGAGKPGTNPVPSAEGSLARGKALFAINCAMCHGPTSAKPGPVGMKLAPPPPGLDHEMVRSLSDADIFTAVTQGFGRMPPFGDKLTAPERWCLVNYLRTRD